MTAKSPSSLPAPLHQILLVRLLAWSIAPLLDLHGEQRGMLLIFGALPPTVLNYIFAELYRQEPAKVASIVMIGNIAALFFVPLALP